MKNKVLEDINNKLDEKYSQLTFDSENIVLEEEIRLLEQQAADIIYKNCEDELRPRREALREAVEKAKKLLNE